MELKEILKQSFKNAVNRVFLPAVYNIYRRGSIRRGSVIFADSNTDTMPESMRLMYEEVKSRGLDVTLCLKDLRKLGFLGKVRFMVGFMKLYATAEYVFICNYFVPVTSCKKRRGTKVIQLWHSCGLLKKFAYDTPYDISPYYKGDVTKNFSLITVSSKACVPVWQRALKLQGSRARIVQPTGVSRTDVFFDKAYGDNCKQRLYELRPELRGKKIVLYAPTFRGTAADPVIVGKEYADSLEEKLGEGWAVIQKLHPHIPQQDSLPMTTGELFACADVLVTDYSSLLFEYVLLRKPFVIFAPDYEQFKAQRGFYEDPSDFPCQLVTDGDALAQAVKNCFGTVADEEYEKFVAHHMDGCTGDVTKRLADSIFK